MLPPRNTIDWRLLRIRIATQRATIAHEDAEAAWEAYDAALDRARLAEDAANEAANALHCLIARRPS